MPRSSECAESYSKRERWQATPNCPQLSQERTVSSKKIDSQEWLDDAILKLHTWIRSNLNPREELEEWWSRYGKTRALTRRKFTQQRKVWLESGIVLTNDPDEEYRILVYTAQTLSPWVDASEGATIIIDALTSHYGFDKNCEKWLNASNGFRRHLTNYLRYACNNLPNWLRTANPNILIRDAVSPPDHKPCNFKECLDCIPIVHDELNRAMEKFDSESSIQFAKELRINVERHINILLTQNTVTEDERRDAMKVNLLQLRHYRVYLERALFKEIQNTQTDNVPVPTIDKSLLLQLMKSLDEYKNITKKIGFPHTRDPKVIKIRPVLNLSAATGVEISKQSPNAVLKLRNEVNQALKYDTDCQTTWKKTRMQKVDWTPATRLSNKLLSCLGNRRTKEILQGSCGVDVEAQVKTILENHSIENVLSRLDDREISSVIVGLNKGLSIFAQSTEIPKREKIKRVIAEIGSYSGGLLSNATKAEEEDPILASLNAKIAKDEFDVFLAHNSLDNEEVLEICNALMSKGIYPWLDSEQIPPGRWFQDVLQSVIPRVKSAAIIIGKHGIGRWQSLELRAFISQCVGRKIPVIPVLLPHTEGIPKELLFLRELNHVSFKNSIQDSAAIDKLVWGITGKKP